jgi:N-acyl-phosphatidylethanolamine-hydrolysing phospholipase D
MLGNEWPLTRRRLLASARAIFSILAILGSGALLVAPLAASSSEGEAEPSRIGPAPRDSSGRFLNWNDPLPRGGVGVRASFFWSMLTGSAGGEITPPERVPNNGSFLRTNDRGTFATITWIGHSSLLIQMGQQNFLTDPVWSRRASPVGWAGPERVIEPGLAIEDLPPINFVLISHNHYDHLDLETLKQLAERFPGVQFWVPVGNAELLIENGIEAVFELDWGGSARSGELEIVCLPAQHWSQRTPTDRRKALWSSWAVRSAERSFYFGGDTGYFSAFEAIGKEYGPFDLAALPIGAYEPSAMMQPVHLNPEEAVRAARDLRARQMMGIHFGTFVLTEEPFSEPPVRFRSALEEAGLSGAFGWLLAIGETRAF